MLLLSVDWIPSTLCLVIFVMCFGLVEMKCSPSTFKYCHCLNDIYECDKQSGPILFVEYKPQARTLSAFDERKENPDDGNTDFPDLPPNFFEGVENTLIYLFLSTRRLKILSATYVGNCKRLQRLYINSEDFFSIPDEIIKNCTVLDILSIQNTKLQFLPRLPSTMDCNIRSLLLNGNILEEVPVDFLFRCSKKLEIVNLASNKLRLLPEEMFSNCGKVMSVDLQENKLENLPRHLFKSCNNLEEIRLNSNIIRKLSPDIFSIKESSLRFLSLQNNALTELPANFLADAELLQELNLAFNNLTSLPMGFLGKCKSLRQLNLEGNSLQNLSTSAVDNCNRLYELNLKNNNIISLAENFLSVCPNTFSSLSLDYNRIETVPQNFLRQCPHLMYISLTGNKLSKLPPDLLLEARHLKTLKLSDNLLVELPEGLARNSTSLQLLDVSHNRLSLLDENGFRVGEMSYLETTYNISFNGLTILQMGLFRYANLPTELDASNNNISRLEEGWTLGLQNLKILNLNHNSLISLKTRHLMLLDNLNRLHLADNKLLNLDTDVFVHMFRMDRLDLSHNVLDFESYFSPLIPENLHSFNLSHNVITHFPLTWARLLSLSTIDLSYNKINQLDLMRMIVTLNNRHSLASIYLSGNLIPCSCEILGLADKHKFVTVLDLFGDNCTKTQAGKAQNSSTCANTSECPSGCQCGQNFGGAIFIDCKDSLLTLVPSKGPTNVTMLDISDSNITDIENLCNALWTGLTHLTANNAFSLTRSTSLMQTTCFRHLRSLLVLDLSLNNITELLENLLNDVVNLRSLNLSGNPLGNLPTYFFRNLSQLRLVDLSFTKVNSISYELFFNLTLMTKLILTGNNITVIQPNVFSSLTNLTELYLNDNKIQHLSSTTFSNLTNLQVLDVSFNLLDFVEMFQLPPSLVILRLKQNKLSGIFQGQQMPSSLTTLDLRHNLLNKVIIDSEIYKNIYLNLHLEANRIENVVVNVKKSNGSVTSVIKLYLLENPLVCDCKLSSLVKFAGHRNKKLSDEAYFFVVIDDVVCTRPVFHKGTLVSELSKKDLLCEMDDNFQCPEQCWCYSNGSNEGVIMDCHARLMTDLPETVPTNVTTLYVNDLATLSSIDALARPEWKNIRSLYLRDCCKDMQNLNVSVLKQLGHLMLLDLNDDCRCTTTENIRFNAAGVIGPCTYSLPPPVCLRSNTGDWIWRECSSTFVPPSSNVFIPMCYVTFQCDECECYLTNKEEIIMNCSRRARTELPSQSPAGVSVLDMDFNNVVILQGLLESRWQSLTILYIRHNRITALADPSLPPNLYFIELAFNLMVKPTGWLNSLLHTGSHVYTFLTLANNSWVCDCNPPTFGNWSYITVHQYVRDINQTYCEKNKEPRLLLDAFQCPADPEKISPVVWISLSVAVVLLALITAAIVTYFLQGKTIKLWLFTHHWCSCLLKEESFDDDKMFDAFISYSNGDALFVAETLLPGLETADDPRFCYQICIHERDWLIGGYIPSQIIESVQISRRTIIVLSQNFLNSTWANLEFKIAFQQALNDRINRLIVVIPEEVPSTDEMDPELRMYVTLNSYIKYQDPKFWEKLRYSMPHKVPDGAVRRLPPEFITLVEKERSESEATKSTAPSLTEKAT